MFEMKQWWCSMMNTKARPKNNGASFDRLVHCLLSSGFRDGFSRNRGSLQWFDSSVEFWNRRMRIPRTKMNAGSNELRMRWIVIEVAMRKNQMTWTDERSSANTSKPLESFVMIKFVSTLFHVRPSKPQPALKEANWVRSNWNYPWHSKGKRYY